MSLAMYLTELALLDSTCLAFPGSQLATAALLLAHTTLSGCYQVREWLLKSDIVVGMCEAMAQKSEVWQQFVRGSGSALGVSWQLLRCCWHTLPCKSNLPISRNVTHFLSAPPPTTTTTTNTGLAHDPGCGGVD